MKSFTVVLLSLSLLQLILGPSSSANVVSYSTPSDEFDKALNTAQLQDLSLEDSTASIDSVGTPFDFSGLGVFIPLPNPFPRHKTNIQTKDKNLSNSQHKKSHAKRFSCFPFLNRRTAPAKLDSDSNGPTECHSRSRHNQQPSDTSPPPPPSPSSPSSDQQRPPSEQEHFDSLIPVFNELVVNTLKLPSKYFDAVAFYQWRSNVRRWLQLNDLKMISELMKYIQSMQLLLKRYEYDMQQRATAQSASKPKKLLTEYESNLDTIVENPDEEKRAVRAEMGKLQKRKTKSWLKSLQQASRPLRDVFRQKTATKKHEEEMLKRYKLEQQREGGQ